MQQSTKVVGVELKLENEINRPLTGNTTRHLHYIAKFQCLLPPPPRTDGATLKNSEKTFPYARVDANWITNERVFFFDDFVAFQNTSPHPVPRFFYCSLHYDAFFVFLPSTLVLLFFIVWGKF